MNEIEKICRDLITALANGGYQGLLLVAAVWLGLKFFRRFNAATRHGICLVTLLVVAALPVAHWFLQSSESEAGTAPGTELASEIVAAEFVPLRSESSVSEDPLVIVFNSAETDVAIEIEVEPKATALAAHPSEPLPASPVHTTTSAEERSSTLERPESNSEPAPSSVWSKPFSLSMPGWACMSVIAAWAAIALMRCVRLAWQLFLLARLKSRGSEAPEDHRELFSQLCAEGNLCRQARLLVSESSVAPMVLGFFRPVVLLPRNFLEEGSREQLTQVLRHELAHVARRDDWANLAQQFVGAIAFFHPGVWWLCRRLTTDREIACDDHVVARLKDRRGYALFLTEFAGRMLGRELAAAPAAWSSKSQLKERIDMLLDAKRDASPRWAAGRVGMFSTAAVLLAIVGLQAGPRLALAEPPEKPALSDTAPTTSTIVAAEEMEITARSSGSGDVNRGTASITFSGPRPKPTATTAPAAAPAPAPITAVVAHPPTKPLPPVAAVIASAPSEPMPPKKAMGGRDPSVEKRIERLERMVEQLLARERGEGRGQDMKWDKSSSDFKHDFNFNFEGKGWGLDEKELARIHEQVQREVARAHEQAARAMREAQKAQNEFGKQQGREKADARRQALEAKRHALEQQIHALEQQMKQLEDEQERSEGHHEHEHQHHKQHKNSVPADQAPQPPQAGLQKDDAVRH